MEAVFLKRLKTKDRNAFHYLPLILKNHKDKAVFLKRLKTNDRNAFHYLPLKLKNHKDKILEHNWHLSKIDLIK